MKRTKTLSAISFTAYDVEKTLRWTPAVQNATHRDVEQPLGCQGRRTCKRQSIGNEILLYAAGRLYSVLSRFRTELTEKKAFDSLLSEINLQLEKHRIIIHQGVKVDASITQSSFHSKKPKTFEIAQDRKEDELPEEEVEKQEHFFKEVAEDGVDKEAR